jgi:hypothetical protein
MTPRDELNALLDAAMRQALRQVQEQGKHAPFALAVTTDGEQVSIDADGQSLPDPQARHAWITAQLAEAIATGRYRAIAVTRNISLTHNNSGKQTEAVEVTLDHRDDQAVTCYLPYEFRRGQVSTAQIMATAATTSFFPGKPAATPTSG